MEKYREKLDFGNNPVSSLFFFKANGKGHAGIASV